MVLEQKPKDNFQLPASLVSPSDLSSVIREIEALEDLEHQAALKPKTSPAVVVENSLLLKELASLNRLYIDEKTDRLSLKNYLEEVNKTAPVLHISFAANPSTRFIGILSGWLRANIHPQVLIRIGLEPSIAAGCVVRTINKQFDFSLRARLDGQRSELLSSLREAKS